ncbi:Ig-like domain-containing protein, partial [Lysinibacillus sp. S2017]
APKANLTREQAAKMIVEAYGLTGKADLSTFADAKTVEGKWSESYLSTAVATGVINGKGDKLAATDSISRQEFAVMLTRAMNVEVVDNSAELLADVEKATTALDTAVKALNTEVKANEIATAKAEVTAAKAAVANLASAVEAAKEVVTEEQATATKEAIATANKAIEATEAVIAKAEEAAKDLTVESVKAINATQIEVKFSKAVDAKSAEATANYKLGALDKQTAKVSSIILSEDEKTVVITMDKAIEKRFQVKVANVLEKDSTTKTVKAFDEVITFAADTTAPTIVSSTQVDANNFELKFSEPMAVGGSFTFTNAKGEVISDIPAVSYKAGATSVTINLKDVKSDEKVTVTIKNAKDMAGNLISPQPTTVELVKKDLATFEPTISSITQTGAKTFSIKFSEAVVLDTTAPTNITLDPSNVVTKLEKVSDTEYKVTVTNNLNGLATVKIAADQVTNKLAQTAGDNTKSLTKLVTFAQDKVAPKATSKLVTNKLGKQVIELTFDKDVKLANNAAVTVTGSQVKDYVITSGISATETATYADSDNKKVVHVSLDTAALKVEGAAYTLVLKSSDITSDADVAMVDVDATFTGAVDGNAPTSTNEDVATVKDVKVKDNDTLIVEFNQEIDKATASDVSNYSVTGTTVESAQILASNTKQVVLKIKKNSLADSFERTVTVENVKALNSTVTMEKFTMLVNLKENVRPTVASAKITGAKEITVTFTESVTAKSHAFTVTAGTTALKATTATASGEIVKITTTEDLSTLLKETIVLEPAKLANGQVDTTNFAIVDGKGNALEAFTALEIVKP